jgi:hypothetical protein
LQRKTFTQLLGSAVKKEGFNDYLRAAARQHVVALIKQFATAEEATTHATQQLTMATPRRGSVGQMDPWFYWPLIMWGEIAREAIQSHFNPRPARVSA